MIIMCSATMNGPNATYWRKVEEFVRIGRFWCSHRYVLIKRKCQKRYSHTPRRFSPIRFDIFAIITAPEVGLGPNVILLLYTTLLYLFPSRMCVCIHIYIYILYTITYPTAVYLPIFDVMWHNLRCI